MGGFRGWISAVGAVVFGASFGCGGSAIDSEGAGGEGGESYYFPGPTVSSGQAGSGAADGVGGAGSGGSEPGASTTSSSGSTSTASSSSASVSSSSSASSSSSGGGSVDCSGVWNSEACGTCLESNCCAETAACRDNSLCWSCIRGEQSDSVCNANGRYQDLGTCFMDKCGSICEPAVEPQVGAECAADVDCGAGMYCSKDDPFFGGVVQGGYCTKACDDSYDCPDDSGCNGETCVLLCTAGGDVGSGLSPDKCAGRENLGCMMGDSGYVDLCVPLCVEAGCPSGRSCNRYSGLCEIAPVHGSLPDGAGCDPQASTDPCHGFCTGVTPSDLSYGVCTGFCVMDGDINVQCGGLDKAVCAFGVYTLASGDLGLCAGACRKHSDCAGPGMACFDLGLGTKGYCLDAEACDSNADCDLGTCTTTPEGKYCRDQTFPVD